MRASSIAGSTTAGTPAQHSIRCGTLIPGQQFCQDCPLQRDAVRALARNRCVRAASPQVSCKLKALLVQIRICAGSPLHRLEIFAADVASAKTRQPAAAQCRHAANVKQLQQSMSTRSSGTAYQHRIVVVISISSHAALHCLAASPAQHRLTAPVTRLLGLGSNVVCSIALKPCKPAALSATTAAASSSRASAAQQ